MCKTEICFGFMLSNGVIFIIAVDSMPFSLQSGADLYLRMQLLVVTCQYKKLKTVATSKWVLLVVLLLEIKLYKVDQTSEVLHRNT